MSEYIEHYGTKRHSGRYPWGSGKDPQRSLDILAKSDELKAKGLSEKERAAELGMSINALRSKISYANAERKQLIWESVHNRLSDGKTDIAISRELDLPESTVRKYKNMENPKDKVVNSQLSGIEGLLSKELKSKQYLDVGPGTELDMGVTRNKLNTVIKKMEEDGYYVHNIPVPQMAGAHGNYTTVKVLSKESDWKTVIANKDKIKTITSYSDDGGTTFEAPHKVQSIAGKRVHIVYGDEGGTSRDGLMELRRGTKDLDLGNSKYAQVRIGVDDTHYLKGMAIYGDKFPAGKDVIFYTNKPKGTPMEKVLKPMKDNPDNPFGATIQKNGQRGALNIVNKEGDWLDWKSTFSSQFLSKQPYSLVKEQAAKTTEKKLSMLDEIKSLTNPTLKKKMLLEYADELDGSARSLKLLGFPKTQSHVILPFTELKPNEVYAPNYKNGDRVALVRHPHGGKFEIPELTVNNNVSSVKKILKNASDAIGIHPSVASTLSGADFDGDSVLVIPNNHGKVKSTRSLKELKNFDPNEYKVDRKTITSAQKQTQMGVVSNLITDMSLKNASSSELARAVKHSMVVIDAEKHNLDWRKSAEQNGIAALQRKYQAHVTSVEVDKYSGEKVRGQTKLQVELTEGKAHRYGASTLISKADKTVDLFDPITKKKKGSVKLMDVVDDAYKLSSGTAVENEYAKYANSMKKAAISARNEANKIKESGVNKEARNKYKNEVDSLQTKLNIALSNAPKERQAQIMANTLYADRVKRVDYDKDQKRKLKGQLLNTSRARVGAKKETIDITDREWEAIQNNAISKTKLNQIFNNANQDRLKALATPKKDVTITSAKQSRIKSMLANGYTQAQIAEAVGVSLSTVNKIGKGA